MIDDVVGSVGAVLLYGWLLALAGLVLLVLFGMACYGRGRRDQARQVVAGAVRVQVVRSLPRQREPK